MGVVAPLEPPARGARLKISPPAVTRAVASLEGRLGARLFNRTTRSLSLTEAGLRFLERARRVLAELDAAERGALAEGAVPVGHLTVTASVTFGRSALAHGGSSRARAAPGSRCSRGTRSTTQPLRSTRRRRGITIALSYMVAEKIAEGRLKPVLESYTAPPAAVQLVHPQSRLVAPKIRAFVDFVAPRLTHVLGSHPTIPAHPRATGTEERERARAARARARSHP